MKKGEGVRIEGALGPEALRVLRQVPGLTVTAEPRVGSRHANAILAFDDRETPIAVEFRRTVNAATAWEVVHHAESLQASHVVLVASRTTAKAREILGHHGISVADGLGHAHLELPGLLIHIEGGRHSSTEAKPPTPTRLRGKAGVVAQAMLQHPAQEWQVVSLAAEAEVSTALAHRVLTRLEREGIVTHEGAGPNRVRRLMDPTALLDLWAEEHTDRPERTLAYLLAQSPHKMMEALSDRLGRNGIAHALTGAAASSLVAPFVTAIPIVELWVQATTGPDELYEATRARPVDHGHNVVFLQDRNDAPLAFCGQAQGVQVVNRFRLYVDLLRDPRRGQEQAQHLRTEVIRF